MHYESKKIAYYPGNLSKFVERVPEAKSYYTLAATSIRWVDITTLELTLDSPFPLLVPSSVSDPTLAQS